MLTLYVNGDSHTAAAEAVNPHAFAGDDGLLDYNDQQPHPTNLEVSWGNQLSISLKSNFVCQAQSGGSNARILRTTRQWLDENRNNNQDKLIIIQWSTWEREEWLIDGTYYQVNGSGIDIVPEHYQEKYKQYIANLDWNQKTVEAHNNIWQLHQELLDYNIPHIFFNGNNDFSILGDSAFAGISGKSVGAEKENHKNWGHNYVNPYDPNYTYDAILRSSGFKTVRPNSWHFGKEAHSFFAQYMLQYIINNKIV